MTPDYSLVTTDHYREERRRLQDVESTITIDSEEFATIELKLPKLIESEEEQQGARYGFLGR